jgi:hypothetical protein
MPKLNESRALAVETDAAPIANASNAEWNIFILSSVQKTTLPALKTQQFLIRWLKYSHSQRHTALTLNDDLWNNYGLIKK